MNELKHQARNNIMHAVYHLEQNKIHIPGRTGGWYCGNKEQFIARHVAAIEYFTGQLNGAAQGIRVALKPMELWVVRVGPVVWGWHESEDAAKHQQTKIPEAEIRLMKDAE
jgi:hypothetical protein